MTGSNSKTNIQIIPARTIVIPNDRVSKKLFNLTTADLRDWIEQHKTVKFTELLNAQLHIRMTRHKDLEGIQEFFNNT